MSHAANAVWAPRRDGDSTPRRALYKATEGGGKDAQSAEAAAIKLTAPHSTRNIVHDVDQHFCVDFEAHAKIVDPLLTIVTIKK